MSQHKYGAKPITIDGIRFASTKEGRRYRELKLLEKAGEIEQLRLQPKFPLCVVDMHWDLSVGQTGHPTIGEYRADFHYYDKRNRRFVVEDVKGYKTPLYRWKKKHLEIQYGITILET